MMIRQNALDRRVPYAACIPRFPPSAREPESDGKIKFVHAKFQPRIIHKTVLHNEITLNEITVLTRLSRGKLFQRRFDSDVTETFRPKPRLLATHGVLSFSGRS